MNRLMYVIIFTPDLDNMKSFYRDDMGFDLTTDSQVFAAFATGGASLALMALSPQQKREFELCFNSADLDADVRMLKSRGLQFIDSAKSLPFGRVIHARDPEGNLLSLLQPSDPPPAAAGAAMTAVVLNCRDVGAQKAWYRDRFGLAIEIDSPWWVEFDAGETHVALHPLVDHAALETHHAGPVTVGFASGDLDEWVEELGVRGVEFAEGIIDRGFGRFAEVRDPDGNALVLRDSPAPPTLEEKLAEDFETGDEPHHVAIRRVGNKNSKAVSRVAVRPEYHNDKKGSRAAESPGPALALAGVKKLDGVQTGARTAAKRPKDAPSVRGGGPNRTRLKPVKSSDPERILGRPASGHLKEATRRAISGKQRAVASASRSKAVKRAAPRKSAPARAKASGGKRSGGKRSGAKRGGRR
ncbi:MAG: VOC family protein [Candidatus Eiseniibacteriota bacterium]